MQLEKERKRTKAATIYFVSVGLIVAMNVGFFSFGPYVDSFRLITAVSSTLLAVTCILSKRIYRQIYPFIKRIQIWIIAFYGYQFLSALILSFLYGTSLVYCIANMYLYLWVLLVYPLSYVIMLQNGIHKLTKLLYCLGFGGLILKSVVWYLYNYMGMDVMHYLMFEYGDTWRRNGNQRIPGSCITVFLFACSAYYFLYTKEKWKKVIYASAIGFLIWYSYAVYQSRAQFISYSIALLAVLCLTHNTLLWKILAMVAAMIIVFWVLQSDLFISFQDTVSNSNGAYRFTEIPYYYGLFKENWLLGFYFRTNDIRFFRGAAGNFYLSDIGILAELFKYGILGLPVFLYPFYRMAVVTWRLWKAKAKTAVFAMAMIAFLLPVNVLSNDIYVFWTLFSLPIVLVYTEYIGNGGKLQ